MLKTYDNNNLTLSVKLKRQEAFVDSVDQDQIQIQIQILLYM